jgi:hypothetical protein
MTKAHVMLLGTFHFQDGGHNRVKPQHEIDVLSPERQREVDDVLDRLQRFQPTKIAIERRPGEQAEVDEEYRQYRAGAFALCASESNQIGYKLAKRLNLPALHCVDVWGRYYDPAIDIEAFVATRPLEELDDSMPDPMESLARYAEAHGQHGVLERWERALQSGSAEGDRAKMTRTLRETLLSMNTEAAIHAQHHSYLSGPFTIGTGPDYPGVDYVCAWYNRNLRIFANLQRITASPDDRILAIYGSDHVPILRHCVMMSPDHALVEVADYLA